MDDHTDVVAGIKAEGVRLGLRRLALAQYIVIHTAWALRSEGVGLRRKPGGAGFDYKGTHFAGDIVSYLTPAGAVNVDILGNAGGPEPDDLQMVDDSNHPGVRVREDPGNIPVWSAYQPDPSVDQYHVDAIDPEDAPTDVPAQPNVPTPVPQDLVTYLQKMEQRLIAHSDQNREKILDRFEDVRKSVEGIGKQILGAIGLGNLFR